MHAYPACLLRDQQLKCTQKTINNCTTIIQQMCSKMRLYTAVYQ